MRSRLKVFSRKQKAKNYVRSAVVLCTFSFLLIDCKRISENPQKNTSPKFDQYYNQGEQLYTKHCSNCHQKNGSGLGRVYPPLHTSDFMKNNFNDVICLMRFGKTGDLTVNGVHFNQRMPAIPQLTDLEIAEIATYIYNTWQHQEGIIEVKEVSQILNSCPQPE